MTRNRKKRTTRTKRVAQPPREIREGDQSRNQKVSVQGIIREMSIGICLVLNENTNHWMKGTYYFFFLTGTASKGNIISIGQDIVTPVKGTYR